MQTFLLAFGLLLVVMLGMAVGVILSGRTIKGSCGGLNAVGDADQCLVCSKPIDPDSPLRERLNCPRARKMLENAGLDMNDLDMDDLDVTDLETAERASGDINPR
ncbi:MAG: (Na+)-NQR maturation NqrM [Erythrobacter sp.]|nr:(Na+)-NQR maturation NqrM [Erythrobacter sp.]